MVMKESVENQQPIESQKQGKLSTGTGGKLRLNLAEKNLKLFWSALKVYLHQLRYVCKKSLVLQVRSAFIFVENIIF
jgi:hypothetical protein